MSALSLLYQREYKINDSISIVIPSVGEIMENEDDYYTIISTLTAMPIDLMVQLDDLGIDFTKCSEYELFLIMSAGLKAMDTSLVFGDLDFSEFESSVDLTTGKVVLKNPNTGIVIDRAVQSQIASVLRKIHHLEKNRRKAGNEEAKEYMIKRAREKAKRNRNRKHFSQLEQLIVAMVNTEQFKYGYEEVKNLSIYQFNESVRQIIKKTDYDNKMYGIYAGTVNPKDMSQKDLNWLVH